MNPDWLFLGLYNGLLLVGSLLFFPLWLYLLIQHPKTRAGLGQKLGFTLYSLPPKNNLPRLWIHCVSVGELNAAASLIMELQRSWDVVISTTTLTGQTLAKARYAQVIYCPFDLPWVISNAFTQIKPDRLIVMETELWPNLFYAAKKRCTQGFYVVNARLSDKSFKQYYLARIFMRQLLQWPTAILTQSTEDELRYKQLGAQKVATMGNLKFDINLKPSQIDFSARFGGRRVVVFASTHDQEETLFSEAIDYLCQQPSLQVVVAPRHPERGFTVATLLASKNINGIQQSAYPTNLLETGQVLILDTIGQLTDLYTQSHLVIIGGSFIPHGGQNPIEPLALGIPVITGPYMHNFKAVMHILAQALEQIENVHALKPLLQHWVEHPDCFKGTLDNANACLSASKGATQRALLLMTDPIKVIL